MDLYETVLRPILFRMDAENAHEWITKALLLASQTPGASGVLSAAFGFRHPSLEIEVAGIRFPNPIGLAAGFDKDCRLASILPSLGFGFLELGTVTPRPQAGNPRPRIFRIPESKALINRLGFPSCGAHEAAEHLKRLGKPGIPIGINIGMNADTIIDKAPQDYVDAMRVLAPFADYFTVNISSPNTRSLRDLQDRLKLERILTALREANQYGRAIFVKLSPDLSSEQLAGLVPLIRQMADGIVACNTTTNRDGIPARYADQPGGLSGAPLRWTSTNMIAEIYKMSFGDIPLIGVGGVSSAQDAYLKMRVGASLVQVYTGLIYHGPGLIGRINKGLVEILTAQKLQSISEAVGLSAKDPAGKQL